VYFRKGQNNPRKVSNQVDDDRNKPGRPSNEDQRQAFLRTCTYLEENDEEQITIRRLNNQNEGVF